MVQVLIWLIFFVVSLYIDSDTGYQGWKPVSSCCIRLSSPLKEFKKKNRYVDPKIPQDKKCLNAMMF